MRDLKTKDLPTFIVALLICVGLYLIHSSYVGRDGRLPGEVETFKTPTEPQGGFRVPPGERWGYERAGDGTNTNLFVMGPRGPDGKIVARVICDRRGLVCGVVQPDGSIEWKKN
jgi:hypothetical protein